MPEKNVLFLCTGNSVRSVIAETLLNELGKGRFRAFSAGSHPAGKVNPLVLDFLREKGLSTEGVRSKSWDEFGQPGAPQMDFVFTVCDSAHGEVCPIWPGHPVTAHWGVEDLPKGYEDDPEEARRVLRKAFNVLRARILLLLALPVESLDRVTLRAEAEAIGRRT